MPNEIYLTQVGMTMTEGVVAEWYIADGDEVKKGEMLFRLETEKVELEVDADDTGVVKHLVPAGTTREPGDVIGWIYAPGEEIPAVLPQGEKAAPAQVAVDDAESPAASAAGTPSRTTITTPATSPAARDVANRGVGGRILASPAARRLAGERDVALESILGTGPGGRIVEADVANAPFDAPVDEVRIKASPVARRTAQQLGIGLSDVIGTGPGGRIVKEDVEQASRRTATSATETGPQAGETLRLSGMRKTIARNMHESLQSTAQLTMDMEVAMDDAVKLRKQLGVEWQSEGVKPSYTDLVVKAAAKALALHPRMNSTMDETSITLLEEIHVGIAVALEEGLVVPVIRDALTRDVKSIAHDASRLAGAARDGKLGMDDMHGGTFTVTTLGMFGVDSFTPILNAGQTGILGVNRIADGVRWEGDRPIKCQTMRLSLTWDHRVLDGEPAARFLGTVRDLLEAPYRLLV